MERSFQPDIAGRRQAFTLIELLVVIAIIAVLASLIVGLAGLAGGKSREAQVRAQLNDYITAIERYKSEFGQYPPDNLLPAPPANRVNPVINQLYYELTGVVVSNATDQARALFYSEVSPIFFGPATARAVFHRDGFVHAVADQDRRELKSFIASWKANKAKTLEVGGQKIDVLVVPVDFRPNHPSAPFGKDPNPNNQRINPWRYVSTNPTNNPASFDLWAEIPINSKDVRIIGNWKE